MEQTLQTLKAIADARGDSSLIAKWIRRIDKKEQFVDAFIDYDEDPANQELTEDKVNVQ